MSNQYPPPNGGQDYGPPQYQRPPAYQRPGPQGPTYQQPSYEQPHHQSNGPGYQQPAYPPPNGHGGFGLNRPSGMPPAPVRGKPPLWSGIVVLCLAPLVFAVGLIIAFVVGAQQLNQEFADSATGLSHELDGGTMHTLYAPEDDATLASDCTIFAPDFSSVSVSPAYNPDQRDKDGVTYSEVGEFTTTDDGTYRITCRGTSSVAVIEGNGYVTIGLGLIASILISIVIGIVGIAMIVINRVTASRARRVAGPYGSM